MEILGVRQWEGERSRAQNLKNNNLVKWKYQLKPPGVRQCEGSQVPSTNFKNNNLARWKYQIKLPGDRQQEGPKVPSTKFKLQFGKMEILVKTTRRQTMQGAKGKHEI